MTIRKLRKSVYKVVGTIDKNFGTNKPRLIVLCYHSIGNSEWLFSISKNTFIKQISLLQKNYKFVDLDFVLKVAEGKAKLTESAILLTFDDGFKDILCIKEFLGELNISPVLFAIADRKKVDRGTLKSYSKLLDLKEIKELSDAGWDIGSHTLSHHNLQLLDKETLVNELAESKAKLEKIIQKKVRAISYPKGIYDSSIIEVAEKCGYIAGFTMDDKLFEGKLNKMSLPRIGIDNTHTLEEFEHTFSRNVIRIRSFIKKFAGKQIDWLLNI